MTEYPPPFTPAREAREVLPGLRAGIDRVIASGTYLLGPELGALEAELAQVTGRRCAVGVGSGTDALTISMRALGIGPGDEVVVPALTAIPTAAAVVLAGATPVLADVDRASACMTRETIAASCGPRTAAVILVHLYGYPAPTEDIAEFVSNHDLALIEDMAQAFGAHSDGEGAMVGGAGVAACASFYPTKILASLGDGGAILTDDEALAAKARLLRSHGHEGEYRHSVIAGNSRLDEIQAAVLRAKLPHVESWVARRRGIAKRLRSALAPGGEAQVGFQAESPGHAYQVLAARIPDRDRVREALARAGLNLLVHYPLCLAEQEALAEFGFDAADYPESLVWAREELSLPTAPQITDAEIERLAAAVLKSLGGAA